MNKNTERVEQKDNIREEFLTRPLGGLIVKNALPAMASMLFIAFYQTVDGIMVGRRLGPEALASVNILYPVVAVFAALAVMLAVGGNARVAVLLGAGEIQKARSVLGLVVSLGIGLGIGGSLLVFLAMPMILSFLGTSGELGLLAGQYLKALYPFFTLMILQLILEQSVRNDGRPNLAALIMAFSALLNIGLDYLFLFVLDMGISGAALATGLAQSFGALLFTGYFLHKTLRRRPGLRLAFPRGGLPVVWAISVNGSSELFGSLAVGLTTFLFNRAILLHVGPIGIAAFAVVQYLLLFGMTVFMGISNGIQPIISYNHGAGLAERVRGVLNRSLTAAVTVGLAIFILLHWQAESLAMLFIAEHPEALATTADIASIISWSLFFMPVGMVLSGFFTALEEAGKSLLVAVSRGLICNLLGLALFPALWGATGIWYTPVFAEGMTALVALVLYWGWVNKVGLAKKKGETMPPRVKIEGSLTVQ